MKTKILITGPILSQSGYGEQARFALRALKRYEKLFDIHVLNTGWGRTGWLWEDDEERRWIDSLIHKSIEYQVKSENKPQYDMSLQVTIPNEWQKKAPINVGYTAGIETTKITPEWVDKTSVVDRIIVVSNHAKYGFDNTVWHATNNQTGQAFELRNQKPVIAVNYPVRDAEEAPFDLEFKHDFNYLCVAQWGPRKNVDNTIKWFVEENIDQKVGLVLKLSSANNSVIDFNMTSHRLERLLEEYPDRKCTVTLLHGDFSEGELKHLYCHPKIKCMISLSHGEGFGLPLFEAAHNALPIITVPWSGQMDFLHAPDKKKKGKMKAMFSKVEFELRQVQQQVVWDGVLHKDSMWAFAKPGSFKMRLRDMKKNIKRYESQAHALSTYLHENFTKEQKYKQFVEALIARNIDEIPVENLPKVSILTSVYAAKDHIRGFMEDITRQSIFSSNCELILVGANSPDVKEEEEVIKEYVERFPDNIIYHKLDKDPGIYAVWNIAARMASGELLTNANVDDRKAPWSLELHARELLLHPDVDLVYADSFITHKPNETWENNSCGGNKYTFQEFSFENLKVQNLPHQCPMWRASLHKEYGYFSEKYRSAGDWHMWLTAASQGSKMKKIGDVLGLYYFNPLGISTNKENFSWKREEEKEIYAQFAELKVKSMKRKLNIGAAEFSQSTWLNLDYMTTWYSKYLSDHCHIDVNHNLMTFDEIPLDDGSLDLIYSSNVIEHLPDDRVAHMLEESYRLLSSGGTLRLTAPDIEKLYHAYTRGNPDDVELISSWKAQLRSFREQSISHRFLFIFAAYTSTFHPNTSLARLSEDEILEIFENKSMHDALTFFTDLCAPLAGEFQDKWAGDHISWWGPQKLSALLTQIGFKDIRVTERRSSSIVEMNSDAFDERKPEHSFYIECTR